MLLAQIKNISRRIVVSRIRLHFETRAQTSERICSKYARERFLRDVERNEHIPIGYIPRLDDRRFVVPYFVAQDDFKHVSCTLRDFMFYQPRTVFAFQANTRRELDMSMVATPLRETTVCVYV